MKLDDYKLVFAVIGLIGVLLLASPAIASLVRLPAGEAFSELYLLGPNQMAEGYPYNVAVGQTYSIFVGVGNHEGQVTYYSVLAKLMNGTDAFPNSTLAVASPLPVLFETRFALQDNQSQVRPLNFSISSAAFRENQVLVQSVSINGVVANVGKPVAWNVNATAYSCRLLFELWTYNNQLGVFSFDSRYVNLQLNVTAPVLPS